MTAWSPRRRFVRHALFQPVDRLPYIETHGFWPQTVDRWHEEGLPRHVRHRCELEDFQPGDITIEEYFQQEVYTWPSFMPSPPTSPFWPPFPKQVIEEDENYVVFRDVSGVIRRDVKRGRSMPHFVQFPVTCRKDWEALKDRLDATVDERYQPARQLAGQGYNHREDLCLYSVCGAYGLPRNLFGEENLAYAYHDEPDLMTDILEHWLTFYVENVRRFAALIDFDFVYFWEDMAYKTGPLIGPALAERFVFPYYRELIQEMKRLGLRLFSLDTDGNAKVLMDGFINAGINNFMPCEIAAGMEPEWLSDRYGRRCSMMGGIDKRPLAKGKGELEAEVMRKVPKLLARGGYLPGLDHGTPSDIPFDNFCFLVELLRKLGGEIKPDLR